MYDGSLDNHGEVPAAGSSGKDEHNAHNNHHPPIAGEFSGDAYQQGAVATSSTARAPVPAPRTSRQVKHPNTLLLSETTDPGVNGHSGEVIVGDSVSSSREVESVRVCVTDADIDMDSSIHLPPGAEYIPSIRKLINPFMPKLLFLLKIFFLDEYIKIS